MNHSTETALLMILIWCNLDNYKLTVLVLLDLTAAFDTADHHILLNRLKNLVGLSGIALTLCKYETHKIKCGVPQESIFEVTALAPCDQPQWTLRSSSTGLLTTTD